MRGLAYCAPTRSFLGWSLHVLPHLNLVWLPAGPACQHSESISPHGSFGWGGEPMASDVLSRLQSDEGMAVFFDARLDAAAFASGVVAGERDAVTLAAADGAAASKDAAPAIPAKRQREDFECRVFIVTPE